MHRNTLDTQGAHLHAHTWNTCMDTEACMGTHRHTRTHTYTGLEPRLHLIPTPPAQPAEHGGGAQAWRKEGEWTVRLRVELCLPATHLPGCFVTEGFSSPRESPPPTPPAAGALCLGPFKSRCYPEIHLPREREGRWRES